MGVTTHCPPMQLPQQHCPSVEHRAPVALQVGGEPHMLPLQSRPQHCCESVQATPSARHAPTHMPSLVQRFAQHGRSTSHVPLVATQTRPSEPAPSEIMPSLGDEPSTLIGGRSCTSSLHAPASSQNSTNVRFI